MENGKLTKEEKSLLRGIWVATDCDICSLFECPPEGCSDCPLNRLSDLNAQIHAEFARLIRSK